VQPPQADSPPTTIGAAVSLALEAYESLALLREDVEDEWQYVQDLSEAWRSRLTDVADARDEEVLAGPSGGAVARLCIEVGSIEDPHRAIDWLSTFPQAILVAVGERP
jgi:hypothetical protein